MDVYADYIVLQPRRPGQEEVTVTYDLIYAAPDLLEACEAIIKAVNDDPVLQEELVISYFGSDEELPFAQALKMANAALAKAKGIPLP